MRFDIISAIPELLTGPLDHSIIRRAKESGSVEIHIHDLRHYGKGRYRQIDDHPYGGSAGMVLMPEPLGTCIDALLLERSYDEIIYLTPDGHRYQQATANRLSLSQNLLLICGHYKGIDERIRQLYVTLEISIGDYVLSGGELPAMVLVDSVVRLIPGVLGDASSALSDSFQDGLLAPPVYTRPAEYKGVEVPDILRSGHQAKINQWLLDQSMQRTKDRRPDLLE